MNEKMLIIMMTIEKDEHDVEDISLKRRNKMLFVCFEWTRIYKLWICKLNNSKESDKISINIRNE